MPALDPILTANDGQLAFTSLEAVADGSAAGMRVLSVQPSDGLHARVLLDRGMDIGAAWFRGSPVSWMSAAGERPGGTDTGDAWNRVWAGGLVTTCGLRNVGPPDEGFGHHGHLTDSSAELVSVTRGLSEIVVTGLTREPAGFGRGLVMHRTLRWTIGSASLEMTDIVRNEGSEPEQAPILYHVNLGYPFLAADTVTQGGFRTSRGVFPGAEGGFDAHMGAPRAAPSEVFEHDLVDGGGIRVLSPSTGTALDIDWTRETLPRFYTWRWRRPGVYVQALEPANCGQHGRARDRAEGRAPTLEPGEERTTGLTLAFSDLNDHHGAVPFGAAPNGDDHR